MTLEQRQHHLAQSRDYQRKRRNEIREFLNRLKMTPCMDCHIQYNPWIMEFDHVRGIKKFNIGEGWRVNIAIMKEEIEKCDIVCANCHRQRTYKRFQEKL